MIVLHLSNFWTQKPNLRCMGKIPLVRLQKLFDNMLSQIFEVTKANGRFTKYQIKKFAFIFYSSVHWSYIYVKTKISKSSINANIYIYIYIYIYHHHIALVARISLTLSRHSSLSFIALGRSSKQHPVSSHSC